MDFTVEDKQEVEPQLQHDDDFNELAKQIVDESIARAANQLTAHKDHKPNRDMKFEMGSKTCLSPKFEGSASEREIFDKGEKKACSQSDLQTYLKKHGAELTVREPGEYELVRGGTGELLEGGDDSSENIRWPTCEVFTVELGEEKIRELIRTWEFSESWLYHVTLLAVDELEYNTRYRYRVMFSIPTRRLPIPRATASVYFSIDVSKVKPPSYTQVQVYYVFESNRVVHRPGQTTFREQWLRDIINNKVALLEQIDF